MNKFDVKTYESNKNYVIEASAGTGKTYNIVEIVKELVNPKNPKNTKVDLSKILIVTYTDKAAGELKDRIRKELKGIDTDNASIYTIHSFCQNSIKEFGLSANLPLNLNVIDENEIDSFVERYLREGDILKDISKLLTTSVKINLVELKELLKEAVSKYYLNFAGYEDKKIITLKKTEYCDILLDLPVLLNTCENFDSLLKAKPEISYHYNILVNGAHKKSKPLADEIEEKFRDNFDFNGLKYKEQFFKDAPIEELNAFLFFKHIKDFLKDSIKHCNYHKVLASIYLQDIYLKWQKEKELNKSQSFDDMIRYVRETILNDDKLKNKLQNKYDIAIIDEFQDTNQRQFDIFKSIFMEDEFHKIIVVGDPKQSIYSFQGADIDVYYDAVEAIVKSDGEKCMLNKNYRSTADMVSSCNKLFNYYNFDRTTFEDCGYLNFADGDKSVHEVMYEGKPTNAFWIAKNNTPKEIKEPEVLEKKGKKQQPENPETISEYEFAEIAVQQIIDCCSLQSDGKSTKLQIKDKGSKTYRNVTFKDFAVLARTSSEMFSIGKALANAGIPYLRYKNKELFLGRECVHWISLLKAIAVTDFTGRNRNILKKALFSNFFGLTLEQINSEYVNKDDIKEVEKLNYWKELANNRNWEDLFDDIINSSELNTNMKSLKEIQSLAIYKQIGNYCIEYLSKGKSIDDLVRSLTNLSKNDELDDEQNGSIVEKSTNFDCVQIMTIHASKGLQFPVVIGVCGFKGPYHPVSIYTYHEDDKKTKEKRQTLCFDKNEIFDKEETAEWKRLFYVAYTRPQFLLILPYYKTYGKDFIRESLEQFMTNHPTSYRQIHKKSITYKELRKITSKILDSSSEKIVEEISQDKQISILKGLIDEGPNRTVYKHSYSSLSHDKKQQVEEELDTIDKEGIREDGLSKFDKLAKPVKAAYDDAISPIVLADDFPRGTKLGTALHSVFENLDYQNYAEYFDTKIERCFSSEGIKAKPEWIENTKEIVNNVLNADLPIIKGSQIESESFKLNSISYDDKLDEVEFNFNILNNKLKNYLNGFVDMMFRRGNYYSIVDWKSDRLNDTFESYATLDSLKLHVDDSYSIQRVLYAYCLIKWLKSANPNLTESEIFDKHFGGIYYIFIRGCNKNTGNGIYAQTWETWQDLERSYEHIVKSKIGGMSNE